MNMNEQEWQDEEFWDSEHGDDEDFNDVGSDANANNDETFDNAAEWNEDEHEELIARDSILSHSINQRPQHRNQQHQPQHSNNNNNNNHHHHLHQQQRQQQQYQSLQRNEQHKPTSTTLPSSHHQTSLEGLTRAFPLNSTRQVLTVDELEQQLMRTRISNQTGQQSTPSQSASHLPNPQAQLMTPQPRPETSRPPFELSRRSGWSPFGGKDLFTNSAAGSNNLRLNEFGRPDQLPQSLSLELQKQILQEQQRQHQIALMQQQQQQQQQQRQQQHQQQQERLLMSHQNLQCFTVEEIERQMLANSRPKPVPQAPPPQSKKEPEKIEARINLITVNPIQNDTPESKRKEARNSLKETRERVSEKNERFNNGSRFNNRDGDSRDAGGRGNHHREDREYNRDNNNRRQDNYDRRKFNDNRRRFIIIPPQVQLSVIQKVVQQHPESVVRPGEFLQDKISPYKEGLLYKRMPTLLNDRMNHDGILTEKERSWLTKIQEKIQADYDDNLDQDYYYLLYFNRTSKANDSTSKSCGSGVLDRRFIPRERLLYNSGI